MAISIYGRLDIVFYCLQISREFSETPDVRLRCYTGSTMHEAPCSTMIVFKLTSYERLSVKTCVVSR